jgi:hypothetical protein
MTIRQNILLSVIAFGFALSAGCGQPPKDVTADPAFGNFESVVGTWKTKVPLRLVEIRKQLYLVYGLGTVTQASREFPAVTNGTEIRIERMIFRHTFEVDLLDVWGSFASGPYSHKIVNIDGTLFTPVDEPQFHGKDWPTAYYSIWHGPNDPKPKWVVDPEKLERLPLEQGSQK